MRICYLLWALIPFGSTCADELPRVSNEPGCKVRADVQNTDIVRWSGPCKDGFAEGSGTLQIIRAGHNYLSFNGAMLAGRYHGIGVRTDARGNRYEGSWKEGSKDGQGKIVYALGGSYEGEWRDDRYHGQGTITYPGGRRATYEFVKGSWPEKIARPGIPGKSTTETFTDDTRVPGMKQTTYGGVSIPPDRGYAKLNDAQKQRIAYSYPLMDPRDEPPYFEDGPENALYEVRASNLEAGTVFVLVTVGPNGKAQQVRSVGSPSRETTDMIEYIFKNERYKPAKCSGAPCTMLLALQINFQSRQ